MLQGACVRGLLRLLKRKELKKGGGNPTENHSGAVIESYWT